MNAKESGVAINEKSSQNEKKNEGNKTELQDELPQLRCILKSSQNY